MRQLAALCFFSMCALSPVVLADDDWWLWESPTDNAEPVDQEQTLQNQWTGINGGHPVGQTFVPEQDYLYRVDLMLHNEFDRRPLHVALWEWADTNHDGMADESEYAATVAAPPLWTDVFSVPGPDSPVVVNLFPRIAVRSGVPHLLEIGVGDTNAEWVVYCSEGTVDRYPAGKLRTNGWFQDIPPSLYLDLWFRTFAAPEGAPPPLRCADTGEPSPCVSAPAAWDAPSGPGPPATAADYLSVIQSIGNYGRAAKLAGDGEDADRFTLYDACMYRATGNEAYAANVASLFAKAAQHRVNNPTSWFNVGESAGSAYAWVRSSPSLAASDHTLIKKVLVRTGVDLWAEREGGVFNHSLGRALTYKLITELVPASEFATLSACVPGPPPDCTGMFHDGQQVAASDHAAWAAYADERWAAFRESYDIFEGGCPYSQISMQSLLYLIDAYQAYDVWAEPGFKALIDREYQCLLPMGALTVSGDARGWSQYWGAPIAVLEEAAKRLREPKYRWMAQRVFDYRRSHTKSVRADGTPVQLWQTTQDEAPSMCHAYFSVDPTVPAVQPAAQAEQFAASQDQDLSHPWTASNQPVGQTFTATATPLVRIDVRVKNGGDSSPATVKLWTWKQEGYGATVAEPPIYAGTLALDGAVTAQNRSILPFLEVVPGDTYLIELSRASAMSLEGSSSGGPDRYADGDLWLNGGVVPGADLWFRTYTLSDDGSKITTRREVFDRRPSQFGDPVTWADFGPNVVPGMMILRSGYDADDLHVVVNLARGDWYHGHMETGAVLGMSYRGSTLLNDSCFYDKHEKDQNNLLTRRYWGGTHLATTDPMSVTRFADSRGATVAWVGWGDPNGFDIDHHRRYYFVKNRFLVVRDRTTFNESMTAATGNIWHASDVHPEHGTHWWSLYNREPRGLNGWIFKNPEEYVLLYMPERSAYAYPEWKIVKEENPGSAPFKLAQRWSGQAQAGQAQWFDSLLVPYGAELSPAEAAANVDVVYDDGANVVLKVAVGAETWTLVDNPGGVAIDRGGVSTDASYLIARTAPNAPGYLLTSEASRAEVTDGPARVIRLGWPVKTSVELSDTSTVQDSDGDGVPDAADADDDGDGVSDVDDARPYDRLRCGDGNGDACDDCATGVYDPAAAPDADGDRRCDSVDTCPTDFNPSQSDFDHDGAGDRCDLDDGMIGLYWTGREDLTWQPEPALAMWNRYRGSLSVLRATGQYTQTAGSSPSAVRDCNLSAVALHDAVVPYPGEVAFSLVTPIVGGVEGSLGTDSTGTPRPNAHPCLQTPGEDVDPP